MREWTAGLTRESVAEQLQKAGVPAGELITALDSISNEHYLARGWRVDVDQPGVYGDKIVFDGPGFYGSRMAPVRITAAPWVGEHTRAGVPRSAGHGRRRDRDSGRQWSAGGHAAPTSPSS